MKEEEFRGRGHLNNLIDYSLETQVGFLLRRANQRHLSIFGQAIDQLTPTQFATLVKLNDDGPMPQNDLGRRTAMDAATMKGVVDRLVRKGLVETRSDDKDLRRVIVALTETGAVLIAAMIPVGADITAKTLSPLTADEQQSFLTLLTKMANAPTKS